MKLMLKNSLFLLLVVGCAKQPVETSTNQGLMRFAGSNFTTTNSVCVDGIVVAMDSACVKPIEIYNGYPYVSIRCLEVKNKEVPWDQYNVIAVTNPEATPPPSAEIICADPAVRVFIQELPK